MKSSKLDQKKKDAALSILRLKKQMDALKAEYNSIEKFLLNNMELGEEINTKIGEVDMSKYTRSYVDKIALSKMLPFENFVNCVSVQISEAKKCLSLEELAMISESITFEKLNVVLKKVPTRERKTV